jgi:hypothetical protein
VPDDKHAAADVVEDEGRSDERAAHNEVTFRAANESIDGSRRRLGVTGRIPYLCECESESCTELILLDADEYEAARSGPRRFLISRGHAVREATVVEETPGYVIVEKHGVSGEIAEETAP